MEKKTESSISEEKTGESTTSTSGTSSSSGSGTTSSGTTTTSSSGTSPQKKKLKTDPPAVQSRQIKLPEPVFVMRTKAQAKELPSTTPPSAEGTSKDLSQGALQQTTTMEADHGQLQHVECFFCKQKGHYRQQCDDYKRWMQRKQELLKAGCFKCGSHGHLKKECPLYRKPQ